MMTDAADARAGARVGARLGLELEMAVADLHSGASRPVLRYFAELAQVKYQRGLSVQLQMQAGRCVGIATGLADCGLDNGFNLLETATRPLPGGAQGLARLAALARGELDDSLRALAADGLGVINASQHPTCERTPSWYARVRVPRAIYQELVHHRGWRHWEGIDAKAQNGVNIAVATGSAIAALNVAIGLAPASIALFANSPLESARVTGLKENRLTVWPRVYRWARFEGDRLLERYPARPFHDMADYFSWMFGPATVSRSLPLAEGDAYKSAPSALLDGAPCLRDFLHSKQWHALRMDTGQALLLQPQSAHFVHSQIAVFLDARLRYGLARLPSLPALLAAWQRDGGLEDLFETCGMDAYIEGRAPGANFADAELLDRAGGAVAASVLMAPMALQLGLLRRLDDARLLVREWGWQHLGRLRARAMRDALADDGVHALSRAVLDVARSGLSAGERPWLAYADYAVQARECGADRLLSTWRALPSGSTAAQRMAHVIRRHRALPSGDIPH
ncbi:MAG: glutamate-cysteine ligase family protein [Castellaniella sp.]